VTMAAEDLAAEADADIRSVTLGERLGRFLNDERPTAALLRQAADLLDPPP